MSTLTVSVIVTVRRISGGPEHRSTAILTSSDGYADRFDVAYRAIPEGHLRWVFPEGVPQILKCPEHLRGRSIVIDLNTASLPPDSRSSMYLLRIEDDIVATNLPDPSSPSDPST